MFANFPPDKSKHLFMIQMAASSSFLCSFFFSWISAHARLPSQPFRTDATGLTKTIRPASKQDLRPIFPGPWRNNQNLHRPGADKDFKTGSGPVAGQSQLWMTGDVILVPGKNNWQVRMLHPR